MPRKHAAPDNGQAVLSGIGSGDEFLPADLCLTMERIMVRTRLMEERMIKMSKSGEGYFWIGGPGEEAFNAALGLQVKKGEGPPYDFLHLHYRNSATMVAMGMSLIDGIRQMAMTAADPNSMGRNFPCHFARKEWNVIPISSVIEVQFAMAAGSSSSVNCPCKSCGRWFNPSRGLSGTSFISVLGHATTSVFLSSANHRPALLPT